MSGLSRWNPLAGVARSWGHFVRRSRSTQVRTLGVVGAVLVGAVVWVASAPSSSSSATASAGTAPVSTGPPGQLAVGGEHGQHLDPGGQRPRHQRGVPGGVPQLAGRAGGIRQRRRVRGADQGHPAVREADQRRRGDQRPQDQSDHHHLRPDQRVGDAGPVQDLDRGVPGRLRGVGRSGGLDRGRPAVHHPGGPHPVHRPMDHGHQLDQSGLPLPVVDRSRPGGHPPGGGQLGPQRRPHRRQRSRWGSSPGTGPRTRPPSTVPPPRPAPGRRHPGGGDHRRRPHRHRHHRHPGTPGHPAAPQRRGHLGHPAHPLQRLLPGAPGRDRPEVLPQAPPQRLRVEHPRRRSGSCRSPTPMPSTGRRG